MQYKRHFLFAAETNHSRQTHTKHSFNNSTCGERERERERERTFKRLPILGDKQQTIQHRCRDQLEDRANNQTREEKRSVKEWQKKEQKFVRIGP